MRYERHSYADLYHCAPGCTGVQLAEYHDRYMKLGSIPSYAYENFQEMYEAYHKLGGNGMITKMKEEIEELHLGRAGARKEN